MGELAQSPVSYWGMDNPSSMQLLSHIAQRTFAPPRTTGRSPSTFAHNSINYMITISDRRRCVEDASQAARFSKFHFIRRFKRETGMTPGEFLMRFRAVRAMDLLVGTNNSIAAIGRLVGYHNAAAFSRAFLNIAGTSPRAYRRAQLSRSDVAESSPVNLAPLNLLRPRVEDGGRSQLEVSV